MNVKKLLVAISLVAPGLVACGDNKTFPVDPTPDADDPADAPIDTPVAPFVPPVPFSFELASAGPDQVQSATAVPGEAGKFYGAGFASQTLAGAKLVTLVKFSAAGRDATFGTNGVVTTAVEFKGGSGELGIVTQSDGKILISATVAATANAADRDVAVLRFNTDGTPDATFGVAGVAKIDLNSGILDSNNVLIALDGARGVAVTADGIYINAVSRGLGNKAAGGPRTDTDFTVARLTTLGVLDATFATAGQYRLDISVGGTPTEANATPRGIKALPDGTVLVGGYATTPGLGTGAQPVVIKLTSAGIPDASFGGGLFHDAVLSAQTEVYNFAVHGTKIVTGGYGRESGTVNDYISLRFDLTTGERDLTWGGTTNGAVVFDPSGGSTLGSNCRNAIALPDGKTLLTGSTGTSNMPVQDAVFAILDANGVLDTSYGTGIHKFALGADGNDQFWGGAVSGDQIAVVGYKGGGAAAAQTDTVNDDAYAAVFTVR
jgi:uncharacterized delta-60 repeat protein